MQKLNSNFHLISKNDIKLSIFCLIIVLDWRIIIPMIQNTHTLNYLSIAKCISEWCFDNFNLYPDLLQNIYISYCYICNVREICKLKFWNKSFSVFETRIFLQKKIVLEMPRGNYRFSWTIEFKDCIHIITEKGFEKK